MQATVLLQRGARLLAWLLPVLALLPAPATAELMLNPTRVVFAKNQRAAQVELINDSAEPATYRISVVNRRMSETGEFAPAQTAQPGELFLDAMLSYSPRQITLQPGTAQVVRLMIRKPEALAEGEYRSHLHFEKLPGAGGAGIERQDAAPQGIGVVLRTLIGASIPVILRHGTGEAHVALARLALQPGVSGQAPVLAFHIERGGASSVYGDLAATFHPDGGGEHLLARANGVAVYTPNRLRRAALPLQLPAGIALSHGKLRLVLRERVEAGARLLAEATLALP